MTWLRARALPLAGILCLAGQGILLFRAGTAAEEATLPWPGLFLFLTAVLVLALALGRPSPGDRAAATNSRSRRLWRVLALAACALLLAVGSQSLSVGRRPALPATDDSAVLEVAVAWVARTDAALEQWWARVVPQIGGPVDGAAGRPGGAPVRGGDRFRLVSGLVQEWADANDGPPVGLVLWGPAGRLAWAGVVEPLPPVRLRSGVPESPLWNRSLEQGRDGWLLRQTTALGDGEILEVQLGVTLGLAPAEAGNVDLVVGPVEDPALTMDDSGLVIRQVGFGRLGGAPFAHLLARPESPSARRGEVRARLLLAALLAWSVALLGLARICLGAGAAVAALWTIRGLLAAAESLRWVGTAFPGRTFPAPPSSWFSLVDPAYFATPFAGGWFASVADALLTAGVCAVTAWYLLQRRGLLQGTSALGDSTLSDSTPSDPTPSDLAPARPPLGANLAGGLAFGAVAGAALVLLSALARLLAENANPRLVGTGVNLDYLGFWGLQIVLMFLSFSLVALVCSLAAGSRWPARNRIGRWLAGGVLAGVGAALIGTVAGTQDWWSDRLLAALVTLCLWLLAPALRVQPRFLRRFAWPAILLLTVCWNYVGLRQVYDGAERSWLANKGAEITESDPDWARYLLASTLQEMRERDATVGSAPARDLWRDEAAWRLYRDSALSDLGYNCSVELIAAGGGEESFFALGFLTAGSYEPTLVSAWFDMAGQELRGDPDMIFRTERRRYAGGEEEVLLAEATRLEGRGWLRVELPIRSWRVATLTDQLLGDTGQGLGRYRPRAEIARPVLLMLADDAGWIDTGPQGIPAPESDPDLAALRAGGRPWAELTADGDRWLCLWRALPPDVARSPGEGFVLGLRRSNWRDNVLDLSRLMLLDLVLFFTFFAMVQSRRWLLGVGGESGHNWRPGFQERFMAGYLLLGLVLLVLVGMSVDQVGYERVAAEARTRARSGLARSVEQLRALLTEQATSLVDSEYVDDLMRGGGTVQRPAGGEDDRGGMVFAADGSLLLDETLSDLTADEARGLLAAGRSSPMVVVRDRDDLFVGTVIPISLGDWVALPDSTGPEAGHGQGGTNGFFFYRQRLDKALVSALAELVTGQIILDVAGRPVLASHPAAVFAGEVPLLSNPDKMTLVLDHRHGASVFAAAGRPFAFTAGRPLPSLSRQDDGRLVVDEQPAVLNLANPDREREYAAQRNGTVLFLAGLANVVLLTALLLALLLSWNIFRPVRLLLAATRSLARGDYQAPLPEAGRDEVGQLTGAFGSMRTDLQSARDDLAAREQFLATVLDRVTVGVAVLDESGQVVVLNPAGAHILAGFRPDDDERTGAARLMREFQALGRGGDQAAGELLDRDSRRTLRGALAPLELPGGRTDTMLVFEDITEFLMTKKMAINAELARQVAHEIKNPLTPIQLSVQLLSQAWQDRHPQLDRIVPDTVERVLQQVTLLRSIASEFSLLGRPGELETETIDLLALVRQVADTYAPAGDPAGGRDWVQIDDLADSAVLAHRDSLLKILGNLMQNSLDAARPELPLGITVEWRTAADALTLIWRDNGAGLPADVADRLFDPYFSTKSKGTGLGLVICRNLADRMGGAITLDNRPDGPGAVAELTLPRPGRGAETGTTS